MKPDRPPVPFLARQRFEAEVRAEITRVQGETRNVPPEQLCQVAQRVAGRYPWADTRTVANLLVDVLGTGWGALFLHWAHEQGELAA